MQLYEHIGDPWSATPRMSLAAKLIATLFGDPLFCVTSCLLPLLLPRTRHRTIGENIGDRLPYGNTVLAGGLVKAANRVGAAPHTRSRAQQATLFDPGLPRLHGGNDDYACVV